MALERDPAIVLGFVEEARSYLPAIREGVVRYLADEHQSAEIDAAYRLTHTIAGAASMVGLDALSEFARAPENTLEEYALVGGPLPKAAAEEVLAQLEDIDAQLTAIAAGLQKAAGDGRPVDANPGRAPIGDAPDEDIDREMLEIFRLEAEEHLRAMSSALALLDRTPDDMQTLRDLRRSTHTLKGAAAVVGFTTLTALAHRMEDLLDLLSEQERPSTPDMTSMMLASTEILEQLLNGSPAAVLADALAAVYAQYDTVLPPLAGTDVDQTAPTTWVESPAVPEPAADDDEATIAHTPWLVAPVEPPAPADRAEPAPPPPPVAAPEAARVDALEAGGHAHEEPEPAAATMPAWQQAAAAADDETLNRARQFVRVPLSKLDAVGKLLGELVISRTALEERARQLDQQILELQHSAGRLHRASGQIESEYEATALLRTPALAGAGGGAGGGRRGAVALVGPDGGHGFDELEFDRYTEFHRLTREMAEATSDTAAVRTELDALAGDVEALLNRQRRLANDLQESVMRMRMVPLRTLATRLHRTVRVTADRQGKQAELVLEGDGLELDSQVLDSMAEPLVQMLRNAVGHGVESPDERRVRRKPSTGRVWLSTAYEGSQAVIAVRDDGRGLNPARLRERAVAGGFLTPEAAAALSDADALALVFVQGLTTADRLTDVSGRGVGMDIVRDTVTKLRGTIAIDSTPGQGTSFTIRLPLTLAVLRALIVRVQGQAFAIPLNALQQIVRLPIEHSARLRDERAVSLGGRVYPVVRLADALALGDAGGEPPARLPLLVVRVGEADVVVAVDEVVEGREIVIKSLGPHLRRVRGIIGATILGDGSLVPILNVADLIGRHQRDPVTARVHGQPARPVRDALVVLIVDDSPSVRRVMTGLIKSAGWTALTAKDGLDAMELLREASALPDVVLTDIEMPRMDGYELLNALKSNDVYTRLPVAMITSRAGEKHRRKALESGAADYLTKPYRDEELLALVRRLGGLED